MDFGPEVSVALVQIDAIGPRRDMTPEEIRAASSMLATMAAMARGALSIP